MIDDSSKVTCFCLEQPPTVHTFAYQTIKWNEVKTLGQICRLEFIFILSDIQLAVIVRFRAVVHPCHSRNSPGTRQTYKSCRGCLFASLDRKTTNSSQRGAPPYERKEKKIHFYLMRPLPLSLSQIILSIILFCFFSCDGAKSGIDL